MGTGGRFHLISQGSTPWLPGQGLRHLPPCLRRFSSHEITGALRSACMHGGVSRSTPQHWVASPQVQAGLGLGHTKENGVPNTGFIPKENRDQPF